MQILHLSPTGTDVATFWTDEAQPDGCFVHFDNTPVVFAVAAIQHQDSDTFKAGLFEMTVELYRYLLQERQGKGLADHNIAFVSNYREVFFVCESGGVQGLDPALAAELDLIQQQMHGPDIGALVREAVTNDRGSRWR